MLHKKAVRELRREFVGAPLKQARQERGMSQERLGRKLGFSNGQFVSNWERGISLPPIDTLPKLCRLLKIPPARAVRVWHLYLAAEMELRKSRIREAFL